MKSGDIVMVFANPIRVQNPIDQARLIERVFKFTTIEYWVVEYLNEPDHYYRALIRTSIYGKNEKF